MVGISATSLAFPDPEEGAQMRGGGALHDRRHHFFVQQAFAVASPLAWCAATAQMFCLPIRASVLVQNSNSVSCRSGENVVTGN
jgi:hypothetical protein